MFVRGTIFALTLLFMGSAAAQAQIPLYQLDDFQDFTTQGWTNGPVPPPTNQDGGPLGAGDRFLRVDSGTFGGGPRLAVFNLSQWIGDYTANGITGLQMDLRNFTNDPLSIRIGLRQSNGNQFTPGYVSSTPFILPADGEWHTAFFGIDAGSLTGLFSPDPLATFLQNVGELRIIHNPSVSLIGAVGNFQVGVDNIVAVPEPGTIALLGVAGVAGLATLRGRVRRRRRLTRSQTAGPAAS
ncbi:MAG TPA: PEP-CTERM sorting domain-containing protein [Gemmatales bacterium]|nr:PEP-CTERM sorting domain-containing protein [Gemmatales bacterium]